MQNYGTQENLRINVETCTWEKERCQYTCAEAQIDK